MLQTCAIFNQFKVLPRTLFSKAYLASYAITCNFNVWFCKQINTNRFKACKLIASASKI